MTRIDVVDAILGPDAAASVAPLRAVKPELGAQMQDYYDSIFVPASDSATELSPAERWLIAIRTASHTNSAAVVDWYADRAAAAGVGDVLIEKARSVAGPWNGDPRATAIMRHVDLIVSHPVDSSKADIDALVDAGLTPGAIVAASQTVAYVSYQLRLIAALQALGALK